ncbi:hypothetical protein O6H91_01G066300 [Diphasiastrum complanatum]|uniref:Uncharacterized protein n=1 Tax=Diphasiastrum complanatum TaxID=34168 RepID=A0ACC2ERS3_DIPCM|nr:hypothetical protein O6H91_01G066300 [Diphasiastrum complanatum]
MASMEVNDTCNDEEDKTNEHHVYDDENKVQKTRKSKQAHKLSMKMQNIVEVGRHVYKGSKKLVRITKKMKGLSELERPSSKAKIMGLARIPIPWIKSDAPRQVTYTKRRKGLKKKIEELAILCGVEASMICYGPQLGKPSNAATSTTIH